MPYATSVANAIEPDWIRVNEAAARLSVHPKTLFDWIRNGTVPVRSIKLGNAVRVDRRQLDAFVEKRATRLTNSA
jgi:excisionase family DNA binding protein